MKISSYLLLFLISISSFAKIRKPEKLYKQIFKSYSSVVTHKVEDTISKEPVNTTILKVLDSNGAAVGYIREIATTTGCNSACLPILVTLFYGKDKKFLTLKSRAGLTKKNHAPFSELDYQSLELILIRNPSVFKSVVHPKMMVDALSGETLKDFKSVVVAEAAYTSLRLNLYNQETLKYLKDIK